MVTDTTQLNVTLNTNWPKQNKEASGSGRRLVHYCRTRIPSTFWGIHYNTSRHFKIPYLWYSAISHGNPTMLRGTLVGKHWQKKILTLMTRLHWTQNVCCTGIY